MGKSQKEVQILPVQKLMCVSCVIGVQKPVEKVNAVPQ